MGFRSLALLLNILLFADPSALADDGTPLAMGGGSPGTTSHAPSMGRGLGEDNQQQNQQQTFQQMYQQVTAVSQGQIQQLSKGRGASDGSAVSDTAKQSQETLKTALDKQAESFKSNNDSFFQSTANGAPKDEGIKPELGNAFKALATSGTGNSLTDLAKGVIQDIQDNNTRELAYIAKIAEQFTAPPKAPVATPKGPPVSTSLQNSGLASATAKLPGNIFAGAMSQQSPVTPPIHGKGAVGAGHTLVTKDISEETIYNMPDIGLSK